MCGSGSSRRGRQSGAARRWGDAEGLCRLAGVQKRGVNIVRLRAAEGRDGQRGGGVGAVLRVQYETDTDVDPARTTGASGSR